MSLVNNMDNNKLSFMLLSPGWPLKYHPNGIVTYIQNIISGFDEYIKPIIMTSNLHHENGNESSVIDLSSFHKKRGVVSKLCNKALGSQAMPAYIKNKCREYKAQNGYDSIIRAINTLNNKVDLIEVEESFGIAKYLVKQTNIPIVTRLHGPWFIHGPIMHQDKNDGYRARVSAEGEAIKLSDGVTAPSLDVLNRVREFYDIPLSNAQVIPNPVPPVPHENQWQERVGEKQTILVVGRFDLHKGGDLALDAFRLVALNNQDVELLFVGPDRGVVIRTVSYSFDEYLEEFIPETNIKKRIKFLGHCESEEISTLRKGATVTFMPSRYDNFPMSLLEALAVGSPIVAAAVGGMKEMIIDDYNGLLAVSESVESMAEKLTQLLNDTEKRHLFSINAIRDCQYRFSPETVAKQTEAFYRQVIDKKTIKKRLEE